MLKLLKKNRKQITIRSMPIHLCMPLGKDTRKKRKKENWISDGLALLHHEEFRNGVLSLAREIYLAGEKVNGAHIKPFIACVNEEKISHPAFILFAPSIHEAVVVERTVACLQNLYQHQPHVSLLATATITVQIFICFSHQTLSS